MQTFTAVHDTLSRLRILPRRMTVECRETDITAPMLRGVFGAALHELDREVYGRVFHVEEGQGQQTPGYVLRPAMDEGLAAPAVEWILLGEACDDEAVLLLAWDIASGMGLGKQRERFHLRPCVGLGPDGLPAEKAAAWTLDRAEWPLEGDPETTACRLAFPAPLRLYRFQPDRKRSTLIAQPTLADLVVAACRRVQAFLPRDLQASWKGVKDEALALSQTVRCDRWIGQQLDLRRYSASQQAELELRGVCGYLDLPQGPGGLWPLLAAAQWLHLGKGTTVGLGQVLILRYHPGTRVPHVG